MAPESLRGRCWGARRLGIFIAGEQEGFELGLLKGQRLGNWIPSWSGEGYQLGPLARGSED